MLEPVEALEPHTRKCLRVFCAHGAVWCLAERDEESERKVGSRGKHRGAGENRAAVTRGEADSVKVAKLRLWAPAKGVIAQQRKAYSKGCQALRWQRWNT